ncbi:hypothetical protein PQR34_14475 [Paraburkholderia sediminicola]|uniref:hypothetical protein n=1 Tax=Paraburkholderia sediminicola TaxID=458836 RepID=UPI0038B97060
MVNSLTRFAEYMVERGVDWHCLQTALLDSDTAYPRVPCSRNNRERADCTKKRVLHWLDVDSQFIADFRKHELSRVKASPAWRGDNDNSKDTVNRKLVHIYQFYVWAQNIARYAEKLVGWTEDCAIRSRLCDSRIDQSEVSFAEKFPECFPSLRSDTGGAYAQHWATNDEVRAVAMYIDEHSSALIAERDILILELGRHVAWRAGSVSSLTTNLFSDREIAKQMREKRDEFLVTPPTQKNGHQFAFRVPWNLALRVNAYIYEGVSDDSRGATAVGLLKDGVARGPGGRAKLTRQSGTSARDTQRRIFLSKDGTPLSAHTVVNRFAKLFKRIGAPKGSGFHSVRRARADEFGDEMMERRRRLNMSTAKEDVERDFIELLGHAGGISYHAYVRSSGRTLKQSIEKQQHDEIVAKDIENSQLTAKLAYQGELFNPPERRKKSRAARR